jgi:diadenosine tetraphosphate (Ap4A) HIT family hydrolase
MSDLHPQLVRDCVPLGRFPLCRLLLMRDANYPWFILVPDLEGITEIHQLDDEDQQQLLRESVQLSRMLETVFRPHKLNIAALGNSVSQLHVHHIVRYRHDAAWPAPVWGRVPAQPYGEARLASLLDRIRPALPADFIWAGC